MKKTLLTFGVLLAVVCCTLAYAVSRHSAVMNVAHAASSAELSEEAIPGEEVTPGEDPAPGVAVSIGTVDAQEYAGSGLELENFGSPQYVAKTSEGTYMGFGVDYNYDYNYDTGEETRLYYTYLTSISSTEESVTIPDSIRVQGATYAVSQIHETTALQYGFISNIQNLTIPATISRIQNYSSEYSFDRNLDAVYMLGKAPEMEYAAFRYCKLYVCDKEIYPSYQASDRFKHLALLPYGWDYEWVTVNVEKNGEFAETYLTQNDYDWAAARYVKVTGNINDIDLSAIKNLTSLMKLDLSETTISSLPDRFMDSRSSLVEVKLPSTLKSIGNSAFNSCSALQTFDLNGITTIGSSVFSGCSSLSYIDLTGVQSIGNSAFDGCSKLNNINLSTVGYIGGSAFRRCYSLESIDLTSVVSIGFDDRGYYNSNSFADCISLKEVTFGNNLQHLGPTSFRNTGIENLTLPNSLASISSEAFANCTNLVSVVIPSSITAIGNKAFGGCSSLSSVSLETGLSTIGTNAFNGCGALEQITIPSTVKSIGGGAFYSTAIKDFRCYAVVPPTASESFIGTDMDMSRTYLYVPPFSKDFYRNTEYWSNFYLMRSIEDQIDYILVDRPLTINLEEEDNAVVANNPTIDLQYGGTYRDQDYNTRYYIGQLTATGEGTLSAGQLTVSGQLSRRSGNGYQYMPTLINYADKMRADNVTQNLTFCNYGSGQWNFVSLPYDVKVSDIIPSDNTFWVIRRYDSSARAAGDTSSTWVDLTDDDILEAGKGYIVSAYSDGYDRNGNRINPTLSFTSGNSITKNNLFRSTDVIVPLQEYPAEFAHNRSWNLIGNPYPCYFDMHYLNEEFTAPVTVWNGSAYVAYSPVDDDLVLSPYEAFFVQCPLEATEMTFHEAGRLHSDDGKPLYKTPAAEQKAIAAEERNVFNFEIGNGNFSDRARIVLNPEAAMEYEVGRDASKFFAESSDTPQIYVAADVNYSISERPVADGMATLGVRSDSEKECTISLSGRFSREWNVILTDKETGVSTDLTESDYSFIAAKRNAADRFTVEFRLGVQTGIDSLISDFGNDADVTVTAVNGVVVYTGRLSGLTLPAAGLYIVNDGKSARKAILK